MSEESAEEGEPRESPASRHFVTLEDLRTVNFQDPISGMSLSDVHAYYPKYQHARDEADEVGDRVTAAVHHMFLGICTIHLHPDDPAQVWVPLATIGNERTFMPEDCTSEQTDALAAVAAEISNHALRARVADVAWSNHRRLGDMAKLAVDSYCAVVTGLLDGSVSNSHGLRPAREARIPMHRALQIAALTTKGGKPSQHVVDLFDRYFLSAIDSHDTETAVALGELALEFRLHTAAHLAPKMEQLATLPQIATDPLDIRRAYDFAAKLYGIIKDEVARQRMLYGAVEQTLSARHHGIGPAGQAAWVQEALQRLNHMKGHEDLAVTLEAELKSLQKAGLNDLGSISVDLYIGDTPRLTAEHFQKLTLSEALKQIGIFACPQDPEQLRADARKMVKDAPFFAAIPMAYIDQRGRVEAKAPGANFAGEQDDAWYARMIDMLEAMRRQRMVIGCIEPARRTIHAAVGIQQTHIAPIVGASLLVPDMQKEIMLLGFTRMFQGDYISSTHLLIPHLEPCLRHVLRLAGHDPAKRDHDGLEQDKSLDAILSQFGTELEQIFGADVVQEIDRLFNSRPGPALRHEVAHGQVSGDSCLTPNTIYANWFLYHLCCRPVLGNWDKVIAPRIDQLG